MKEKQNFVDKTKAKTYSHEDDSQSEIQRADDKNQQTSRYEALIGSCSTYTSEENDRISSDHKGKTSAIPVLSKNDFHSDSRIFAGLRTLS